MSVHSSQVARNSVMNGFRVREDTLFTDSKGNDKPKIRTAADQTLSRLGDLLRRLLEQNETIFGICRAQVMPGTMEQLFLGWHVYTLPRVMLLFTDRRIIALRIRNRGWGDWEWDRGVRTIRWGDVASASVKGLLSRVFKLKLRSGESISYWRMTLADSKKIKVLAGFLQQHATGETSAGAASMSLCPTCLAVLQPMHYECPNCRLEFRNEKTLMWRGLIIPGGASFYIGMTALGVLRFIVESFFILIVLILVADGVTAPAGSPAAYHAFTTATVLLLVLFLEKWLAILYSRRRIRDFLPAQ